MQTASLAHRASAAGGSAVVAGPSSAADSLALDDAARHADRGDPRHALALADATLQRARASADAELTVRGLLVVGTAARELALLPRALAACDEALDLIGERVIAARVEATLCRGHVFLDLGDYDRALDSVTRARGLAPAREVPALTVRCLQLAAMIQVRLSDFDAAESTYAEALGVATRHDDAQAMALIHNCLGVLHLQLGQPAPGGQRDAGAHLARALAAFDAARVQAERAGDARLLMLLDGNTAGTLGDLGRVAEARDAFARQLAAARARHDRHFEALILTNLGEAHRRLGEHADALQVLREALEIASETGAKARERAAHRELAATYEAAGDARRALAHFKAFHELDRRAYTSEVRGSMRAQMLQGEIERVQREADTLRREQVRLARANAELAQQAHEDPLTRLPNRRLLDEALVDACGRDVAVAVAAFDLDRFKSINDRWTHALGDEVLRVFAALLRSASRATDLPVRLGGEEFVLLLRNAGRADAQSVAERVRQSVESYRWEALAPGLAVTVSAGIAAGAGADGSALLAEADRALYRAKRGGRNRVAVDRHIGEAPEG